MQQRRRSVRRSGEKLVVGGEPARFVVVEEGVDDTRPFAERSEGSTTAFFVKGQLENARGRGPNLNHAFSLLGLCLEMGEVVLHGLHGVQCQHVGPVVQGHVHKERPHLVGKVSVNAVVGFRSIRFG